MDVKTELAQRAQQTQNQQIQQQNNPDIAALIKAMRPEIKKALLEVITVERFTRMALSALSASPQLAVSWNVNFKLVIKG